MTKNGPWFWLLEGDASRLGRNQLGLKEHNERVVLSLILEAGSLSKAEIARITRLSPQTVTNLVNRLLEERLLRKKNVVRGRVGQPSTPIELDPDGALSVGVKIGRRSLDLIALSFDRQIVGRRRYPYEVLEKQVVSELIGPAYRSLVDGLTPHQRGRLAGIGVAAPTALENGIAVIGDPGSGASRWAEADLAARIEEVAGLDVIIANDATAACLAEIEFARENRQRPMIYFYLSTLIGGGLVVDGNIVFGRTGNAGAVNAIPLSLRAESEAKPAQLLEAASLDRLEAIAARQGVAAHVFREDGGTDAAPDPAALACFDEWCKLAADALAFAAISGTSFIEAEEVVIDGVLHRDLLSRLLDAVGARLQGYNLEGIVVPALRLGRIGLDARAIGAAILPMITHFLPDKEGAQGR